MLPMPDNTGMAPQQNTPPTTTNRRAWLTAAFACVAMMVSNGMTISGLSVYDIALSETFGWSMGDIKLRDLITLVLTGLLAPLAGICLDRYGVRRCMLVGWSVLALCYVGYSNLSGLIEMYALHAAFALVLVFCGLNAVIILVSQWFVRYRGTAIGIALCGSSLGGALFPQYGTAMIAGWDWRVAFLVAIIFPAILLLVSYFWLRDSPEQNECERAQSEPQSLPVSGKDTGEGVTFRVALRSRTFWALALIAMSTFYTVLGVQAHVYKYMRDAGFDAQISTNAISVFFLSALAGKFVFGFLSDFMDKTKVFYLNLIIMLVGSVVLTGMNITLVWLAMFAFGLGWGGVYSVLQLTVMNTFGTRDAGKILGTITILDASGGGVGIWLTGVLYDHTGSYELPFTIFSGMVIFALLCLTQVKPLKVSEPGKS
ncbi:Hexuronate transporter [Halioglobus japonicus]|nr:Hexuronate transporter [Halioglobus japonicus]